MNIIQRRWLKKLNWSWTTVRLKYDLGWWSSTIWEFKILHLWSFSIITCGRESLVVNAQFGIPIIDVHLWRLREGHLQGRALPFSPLGCSGNTLLRLDGLFELSRLAFQVARISRPDTNLKLLPIMHWGQVRPWWFCSMTGHLLWGSWIQ